MPKPAPDKQNQDDVTDDADQVQVDATVASAGSTKPPAKNEKTIGNVR